MKKLLEKNELTFALAYTLYLVKALPKRALTE